MLVIGVMSGTSADGIEVALARVEEEKAPADRAKAPRLHGQDKREGVTRGLVGHATMPMAKAVRAEVLRVGEGAKITAGELSQLNFRVGEEFAAAVIKACGKFRVKPEQVDLIGSHGQTVFH